MTTNLRTVIETLLTEAEASYHRFAESRDWELSEKQGAAAAAYRDVLALLDAAPTPGLDAARTYIRALAADCRSSGMADCADVLDGLVGTLGNRALAPSQPEPRL